MFDTKNQIKTIVYKSKIIYGQFNNFNLFNNIQHIKQK